uniref:Uncharacterized protein n=1 Tax=Oryza sativa subsp. japonica TaxID=39947 RepID=Q69TZ7_ORYSJ|nr:hypothetical protein [Oryza sativa Japonica Group]
MTATGPRAGLQLRFHVRRWAKRHRTTPGLFSPSTRCWLLEMVLPLNKKLPLNSMICDLTEDVAPVRPPGNEPMTQIRLSKS